jgi:hypothetical protein
MSHGSGSLDVRSRPAGALDGHLLICTSWMNNGNNPSEFGWSFALCSRGERHDDADSKCSLLAAAVAQDAGLYLHRSSGAGAAPLIRGDRYPIPARKLIREYKPTAVCDELLGFRTTAEGVNSSYFIVRGLFGDEQSG